MKKKLSVFVVVLVILGVAVLLATPAMAGGRGDGPVIYVTSQGLYYDSIVTADPLPWKGPFQLLEVNPDLTTNPPLQTEFGPGDPEYRGGRWWVDVDQDGPEGEVHPNGYQDAGDHYFSCPLLGPGRAEP